MREEDRTASWREQPPFVVTSLHPAIDGKATRSAPSSPVARKLTDTGCRSPEWVYVLVNDPSRLLSASSVARTIESFAFVLTMAEPA